MEQLISQSPLHVAFFVSPLARFRSCIPPVSMSSGRPLLSACSSFPIHSASVPVRRVRSGLSVSRRQSSQQAAGLRRSSPSCLPLVGSFVVPNLLQEVHGVVRVTVWRVTSVVGFSEPNNTSSSPESANSAPPLHCNLHDVALLAQVTNTEMLYSPVRSGGTAGTAAAQSQGPSE